MQTKSVHDYHDRQDQIYDWVSNGGEGLMGLHLTSVPDAAIDFAVSQYARFNVPVNGELIEVISSSISKAFFLVDYWNPYTLLHGISDVNCTNDWADHTYEVYNGNEFNGHSSEADPEVLETFTYVPGQAEEFFNYCLSHPGIDGMPYGVGHDLRGVLFEHDQEIWEDLSPEAEKELYRVCSVENAEGKIVVDRNRLDAYIELAAWAGFLWIAGPLGRAFRMSHHEIMDCAATYGECILSSGCIIPPTHYRRIPRPPRSCYRCGVQTWCVEPTQVDESSCFICEHCLYGTLPNFGGANCGTKFCKFSVCPNHPLHHMGQAGVTESLRTSGQLMAVARGDAFTKLHGSVGSTAPTQIGF